MFGVVPRVLWSRLHAPDEQGRILQVARILVARFPKSGRVVVVDSGMGDRWSPRDRERYGLSPHSSGLEAALTATGVDPLEVTDAVITHLHFDHAGGFVKEGADGRPTVVLANAVHHVQGRHLDWARHPSAKDKGSFRKEDFDPLLERGAVNILGGSTELFEGLFLQETDGHTVGMQVPIFGPGVGGKVVAFPSDLIPNKAHGAQPWVMAYDLEPLRTMEWKRELLSRGRRGDWTFVLQHDPCVEAVRVGPAASGQVLISSDCPRGL